MDYQLHYEKLIEKARNRKLDGYFERHHIIPKSLGGSDDNSNLVKLTAREHFVAHLLLSKIYPDCHKMIRAIQMMCVSSDNQERVNNRMYKWLKEKFSKMMSEHQKGENNSQYGTCWVPDIKSKKSFKIKNQDLDFYLSKGFIKGRNKWKSLDKKIEKEKEKQVKLKKIEEKNYIYYNDLFSQFKDGNYTSMGDFHRKKNLPFSKVTLSKNWKKYVNEYDLKVQKGKAFCF